MADTEIKAVRGDITDDWGVDAIVNAANCSLLGGGGVDGAIHRAAGIKLLAKCATLGGCDTGDAKITPAYNLPCRYVIHTVGPVWHGGERGEDELLKSCYIRSLDVALQNNIRKIAFSSISTGFYAFPKKRAASCATAAVRQYVNEHQGAFDLIMWVLFDDVTFGIYRDELL